MVAIDFFPRRLIPLSLFCFAERVFASFASEACTNSAGRPPCATLVATSCRSFSVGMTDSSHAQCWASGRRRPSSTGLGFDVLSRPKSGFKVPSMNFNHRVSMRCVRKALEIGQQTLTTSCESFASTKVPLTRR